MFSFQVGVISLALLCGVYSIGGDEFKIIETKNGDIRGARLMTLLKKTPYYSFKGIPYAKAPIGDLRFKAPEPVDSWNPIVLDALQHGSNCVQNDMFESMVKKDSSAKQSEDCLTLNIYAPAEQTEKMAVLFFIHGGGYIFGSSDDDFYGGDFIVEKKTILVTVNYRLGAFGFLSLDTPEYSGNMGLKDQQLALKWVSDNIDRFGGDNKRITIFGQSAGGASTHFHILSAESRKYFRNAIPMSGTVENYWAMSDENDHLKLAYQIAEELGEPKQTVEELVEVFKRAPTQTFLPHSRIDIDNVLFDISFTPVIERKDAIRPFMVKSPGEIYDSSKIAVDTMFTLTSSEMLGMASMMSPQTKNAEDLNMTLPFRGYKLPLDTADHRSLMKDIEKFYLDKKSTDDEFLAQYVHLLSDVNFEYHIDKSVKTMKDKTTGKIFYFWFSVESKLNVFKMRESNKDILPGAAHGDELCYLFRCAVAQEIYEEILNDLENEHSKISLQIIEQYTTVLTNFAKYGEPSPRSNPIKELPQPKKNHIYTFGITNNGLITMTGLNVKENEFWTKIERKVMKLAKSQRDEL